MEQIAQASGIQSSTLCLHFRDKDEVLHAIAEDYTGKLRKLVATLLGPVPSREALSTWVDHFRPGSTCRRSSRCL